ncbi:CAP domain-containing protein [Sporosarcina highlanderae]|uniref:CAP-associated domain-containing protein n=1 Tax=Sporosarcina highlanderae TaxID=3035916 RepID=A0ABT8JQZ6_9BACL|nr:CAP-associated domain-containing protein [Sporosarcina highlanderae]MDN4607580.1 CAP-associated domain-containing protein [Sporosarcina highlanderae]
MRVLWKIAILLFILLAVFYFLDSRVKENEPLESPVKHGTAIPVPDKEFDEQQISGPERPKTGLSTFVGKSSDELIESFGEPDRIEPSAYGYEWWIYKVAHNFMAGVNDDGKVNQLFSADQSADLKPFSVGQNVNEIYRFSIIETEVNVVLGENIYTFTLNSQDLKDKILLKFNGLYAQVYVDGQEDIIEGVRFIDPKTLVVHQPYDMEYMGELIIARHPSSRAQMEVDRSMERQIFELTNIYREHHDLHPLENNYWLTTLAQNHSKDMAIGNYFSHESPSSGNLSERLKNQGIEHKKAGENIASNYVDAIEAVHGWLNSPAHRSVLLDPDATDIGTGAYGKYYTQVLIKSDHKKKTESGLMER